MERVHNELIQEAHDNGILKDVYDIITYYTDNTTHRPMIKAAFAQSYSFFTLLFIAETCIGTTLNGVALYNIIRLGLAKRDNLFVYMVAICAIGCFTSAVIIPLSLLVMLVQPWILGKITCYALSVFQSLPIHGTMMCAVSMAADRYRLIRYINLKRHCCPDTKTVSCEGNCPFILIATAGKLRNATRKFLKIS